MFSHGTFVFMEIYIEKMMENYIDKHGNFLIKDNLRQIYLALQLNLSYSENIIHGKNVRFTMPKNLSSDF